MPGYGALRKLGMGVDVHGLDYTTAPSGRYSMRCITAAWDFAARGQDRRRYAVDVTIRRAKPERWIARR